MCITIVVVVFISIFILLLRKVFQVLCRSQGFHGLILDFEGSDNVFFHKLFHYNGTSIFSVWLLVGELLVLSC